MRGIARAGSIRIAAAHFLCLALLATALPIVLTTPAQALPSDSHGAPKPCDLNDSGSEHDEFASCLQVDASLAKAPALGERARLEFSITSDRDYDKVTVVIELPGTLQFADPRANWILKNKRRYGAPVTQARVNVSIGAGEVRTFSTLVEAVKTGSGQIQVFARAAEKFGRTAGADEIFLTVGKSSRSSELDIKTPRVLRTERLSGETIGPLPDIDIAHTTRLPKPRIGDIKTTSAGATAPGAGEACVTGKWQYLNAASVAKPSRFFSVQVVDDDTSTSDDVMVNDLTEMDGTYETCFNATDGDEGGQVDPFVRFISSQGLWRVQDAALPGFPGNPYIFPTPPTNNIVTGSTHNFGTLQPGDAIYMRGLQAYDSLTDAWLWTPKSPNSCWDKYDTTCKQYVINWSPTSTEGTYYDNNLSEQMFLEANDPSGPHDTIHEIGHAVMDDVYEFNYPSTPNCSPHYFEQVSSAGCAWSEGFATWYASQVLNDPVYKRWDGTTWELENRAFGDGWAHGDQVESRVSGSMIDLADAANESPWDRWNEGSPGNLWHTFTNHRSANFAEFWSHRAADGFNTTDPAVLSTLFQNTIDYGFRDPLSNSVTVSRPSPAVRHNFRYDTNAAYWSAVALKRTPGDHFGMALWDDSGLTSLLANADGPETFDFVAVDSNRRALGDYYPQVRRCDTCTGSNTYQLQLAHTSIAVTDGIYTVTLGSSDLVAVRDVYMTAGVPMTIRVNPGNNGQNPLVFLMSPGGSEAQTRANAAVARDSGGNGVSETFTYTPTTTGYHGLVLLNGAGSGSYSVLLDSTAPTGTISINNGAPTTTSRNASLNLSATDLQTQVTEMRISTDGTMNSESYIPFSTTANVQLPAGDGTKTVLVQYKNGAGVTSQIYSDDIFLDDNVAPVLTNIGSKSVTEESQLQFQINATDGDGDPLTYSATNLPSGATFTPGTRTFSWTPTITQEGSYNVTFAVNDGKVSDTEIVTITVNHKNEPPVLASIGSKSVAEQGTLSFQVSATDPENGALQYSTGTLPTGATFDASTRTFSWTPSLAQEGNYSVNFTVTDNTSLTDSESVNIEVTHTNAPPVLNTIGAQAVEEGDTLQFVVDAIDIDGDPLMFEAINLPSGASFNPGTRTFSWTPDGTQTGQHEVTFRVLDGFLEDSEDVTIGVQEHTTEPSTTTVNATIKRLTVLAKGRVTPPAPGAKVTVLFQKRRPNKKWRTVGEPKNPKMNATGDYSATFDIPDASGKYRFKSNFAGNADLEPSQAIKTFNL